MRGPNLTAERRSILIAGAMSTLAIVAACSTDSLLSVRPTVDVGQTAGIYGARPIPKASFREVGPRRFEAVDPEQFSEPDESAQDFGADTGGEDEQQFAMSTPEPDYDASADMGDEASMNGGDPSEEQQYVRRPSAETDEQQVSIVRPLPPRRGFFQAGFPRVTPQVDPSVSAEEAACRQELKRAGVRFQDIAPIRDSATCYIDNPVKVSAIGNVEMKPAATLTCRMALTFAKWTNKELKPAVRWKYFTGLKSIRQGSSYSCRRIAGSGTPSAHAKGDALDLMAIELGNGKTIDVKKQGLFAFRARGLLNNVRADGCEYFSTVLGPGYNYDHRNHFHFDLMDRKNGRRACH